MHKTKLRSISEYFQPGFKAKPAVCIGSQSIQHFNGISYEQAWEGYHLAEACDSDVVVVRYLDDEYLNYWKRLLGEVKIINLTNVSRDKFLSDIILTNNLLVQEIKNSMHSDSKLTVFLPTEKEEAVAKLLNIPLHGSSEISQKYGSKSGIRKLAEEIGIAMPPGYICKTRNEVLQAIGILYEKYESIIIKHDMSLSGYFSKKININENLDINKILNYVSGGKYIEGGDTVVVEAWVNSKSALCAHIELLPDMKPIICGAWQQILDDDGITYIGAGPLNISNKAFNALVKSAQKLADEFYKEGIHGSFGPDFLVTRDDEKIIESDSSILIELNARIPYTAFPLEIVKRVKGKVNSGFLARHIKLSRHLSYSRISSLLEKEKLLITEQDTYAQGVVPFNTGMLPWKLFSVVVMAESWDKCIEISNKMDNLFN